MIKFFLKKHKTQLIALGLMLVMFWSGFCLAWRIQNRRDDAQALEQDKLITYLMAEQMRNATIFRKVMILLVEWDDKIENLQRQLDRFYQGLEKQYKWQDKIETPSN